MTEEVYDKAISILRATNDGNGLTEKQLLLVQNAVNGVLTEAEAFEFNQLYLYTKGFRPAKPEEADKFKHFKE